MPPRKGSINTLGPYDVPQSPNAAQQTFPSRSPSPLGSFLSKPSKWFKSSSSSGSRSPSGSTPEPRTSTSSTRKAKISKPTDPRPILQTLKSDTYVTTATASRSVVDLSIAPASYDGNADRSSPMQSRTIMRNAGPSNSLGDLRNMSKRTWSKSADDLLGFSASPPNSPLALDTTFVNRVQQYRKQDGPASAGTDTSTSQHPFPTSMSVSPPTDSPGPLSSTQSSSPSSPGRNGVPHTHSRSHSFTPRLSSKLGPIRSVTQPIPPVPTRPHISSSASDRDARGVADKTRDRKRTGSSDKTGSVGSGHSARPGFPWQNAGPSVPSSPDIGPPSPREFPSSPRKTIVAYPTPTIVEPEPDEDFTRKSRRTSQIIHHSGFLNRMTTFVPPAKPGEVNSGYWTSAPTTSLAKGWKPFKAVLKGSKLYFYKPPNDHWAGIKALFPEEIVADTADDLQPEPVITAEPAEMGRREDVRKKRVYWGRGPHPELVLEGESPRRVQRGSMDALTHEAVFGSTFREVGAMPTEAREADWKSFASAVLLCLPEVGDRAKFETELMRCCGTLITGADDESKEYERAKVAWLARGYLEYHGHPVDAAAWETWRTQTIPDVSLEGHEDEPSTPRPNLGTPGGTPITSVDEIFRIDRNLVARSLTTFHRKELAKLSESVSLASCMAPWRIPSSDTSPAFASGLLLFSGAEERSHWLSLLVIYHLFLPNASGATPARASHYHLPARVNQWVIIGELCRRSGDLCTWRAIFSAVCSAPVARMTKLWHRVNPEILHTVQEWVQLDTADADAKSDATSNHSTPWLADAPDRVHDDLTSLRLEEGGWDISTMLRVSKAFEVMGQQMHSCRQISGDDESLETNRLVAYWNDVAVNGPGRGVSTRISRINQAMSMSKGLEPRRRGLVEPLFWTHTMLDRFPHPLVPLLFPEISSTITLVDRRSIVPSRTETTVGPPNLVDVDFFRGPSGARSLRPKTTSPNPAGAMDLTGTVLQIDDELLVVVQATPEPQTSNAPSRASSRPPSRAPSRPPSANVDGPTREKSLARKASRRMRPSSPTTLDRKTSMNRRNSLPTFTPKPSPVTVDVNNSDKPLRIVVHAATLDRMVRLLIFGLERVVVSSSDDSGETSLRERSSRQLQLDAEEFAETWWFGFRTFVTPLVFFELLRKEYVNTALTDPVAVLRSRIAVLRVMEDWVRLGGGALDALNDPELQATITSFLDQKETSLPISNEIDLVLEDVRQAHGVTFSSFRRTFFACTQCPVVLDGTTQTDGITSSVPNGGARELPDFDTMTPQDLIQFIDACGRATLSKILKEDLLDTVELLETQTIDTMGWFLPQDPPLAPDDLEIQTIHSYLLKGGLEPASSISELGQDQFYRLLPTSLRTCVRGHEMVRKWIVLKLSERRLALSVRQSRMEKVLQATELAMAGSASQPSPRSHAESVLTSAITSAESRAHYRAWQEIAAIRNQSLESVSSMLVHDAQGELRPSHPLVVDLGWLLERILEATSLPNAIEENGKPMVNLDKRRLIHGLIQNILDIVPSAGRSRNRTNDLDMEKLQLVEKDVSGFDFDIRTIRQDAAREGAQTPGSSNRKRIRPFARLVFAQEEKHKRDRALRDRLSKEKRAEQYRTDKREDQLNRAMQPRTRPMPAARKDHRTKKSVSSAFSFMQFMRPISSAFSSDSMTGSAPKTIEELDFVPSGKPTLVMTVADAQTIKFINNERSFTFQVDTEDGGHYLFQAPNAKEMAKWMSSIGHISHEAAQRRLTWIGEASKAQYLADGGDTAGATEPTAVFGVDLTALLRRENHGEDPSAGTIPHFVQLCLSEIEARGFTEVGIYRIAGAKSEINSLVDSINRGGMPITSSTDIYAVCDMVKLWMRQLPDSVIPGAFYSRAIAVGGITDLDSRLQALRTLVVDLPQAHFDVLKRLMEHFYEVTEHESVTQMSEGGLAIVLVPNLLKASDFGITMQNMGPASSLIRTLISHFHVVFGDSAEQEDDGDDEEEEDTIAEEDEAEEVDDSVDLGPPSLVVTDFSDVGRAL